MHNSKIAPAAESSTKHWCFCNTDDDQSPIKEKDIFSEVDPRLLAAIEEEDSPFHYNGE